jgi:hypothetical protein
MKVRTLLALAVAFIITGSFPGRGVAEAGNRMEPIYVTFFSHNEDEQDWQRLLNDEQEYLHYRSVLIAKIKLLHQYNAVVNWESEYVVLNAMKKYEKGDLLKATNGKNVLRWMVEDMGMKVDPHGHLFQYNYADLAYLIESLGVKPSSVVGGFELFKCGQVPGKLDQVNWKKSLEINEDGTIRGRKFPHYSWRPVILGQPGMMGHVFDEFSSGVWHPEEGGDFLKNQINGKFIYIGQGYPFGATNLGGNYREKFNSINYITELSDKIRTGQAPAGKIYTCSMLMRDDYQPVSMELLKKTLEALQDLARSGRIVYKDYESVAQIWRTRYQERPNRFGIENFIIYPRIINDLQEFCRNQLLGPSPGQRGKPGTGPPDPGLSPPASSGGTPPPGSAPD